MANHKSAAKRARQGVKRSKRNHSITQSLRTCEKTLRSAITAKDIEKAKITLLTFASKIDKAATKGCLHAKNASRKTSRLARQVSALT